MLDGKHGSYSMATLESQHWLGRARHACKIADWTSSSDGKRLLLEIAERYERIAKIPGGLPLRPGMPTREAYDAEGS
jgi:hypothetical protein